MDSRIIWTAFFWRDYIADTRSLTNTQRGMYVDLMAEYYISGKPLVANATVLLQLCQAFTEADQASLRDVLSRFFTLDGDVYRHKRIDQELTKSIDLSNKRRKAGSIGGQAKAAKENNNPSNCHTFATVLLEQPLTHAHIHIQEVLKTPTEPKKLAFDARAVELPSWLPRQTWIDFVENRRSMNSKVTKQSYTRLLGKLTELRDGGLDPVAVVDQSIANNWKGFFNITEKGRTNATNEFASRIAREHQLLAGDFQVTD